jgi:hypothetical protein
MISQHSSLRSVLFDTRVTRMIEHGADMKLIKEERTERIIDRNGRRIECVVRRRGIDARAGDKGLVLEQQSPVAVIVDDDRGPRRVSIEGKPGIPGMAWIIPPALAIAARMMTRRRRK